MGDGPAKNYGRFLTSYIIIAVTKSVKGGDLSRTVRAAGRVGDSAGTAHGLFLPTGLVPAYEACFSYGLPVTGGSMAALFL